MPRRRWSAAKVLAHLVRRDYVLDRLISDIQAELCAADCRSDYLRALEAWVSAAPFALLAACLGIELSH